MLAALMQYSPFSFYQYGEGWKHKVALRTYYSVLHGVVILVEGKRVPRPTLEGRIVADHMIEGHFIEEYVDNM